MEEIMVEPVAADDPRWQYLCANSLESTPFSSDGYLAAVGFAGEKFVAARGGKILGGLCLPVNASGVSGGTVPYAPYNGFLFLPPREGERAYKRYKDRLAATTALVGHVSEKREKICFSCHYNVTDMRGVSWYNYDAPGNGKYDIGIAYTAVKDVSGFAEIFSGLGDNRKYSYRQNAGRYALSYEAAEGCGDIGDFLLLYRLTFERQGVELDGGIMLLTERLLRFVLESGQAVLRYAQTAEGKRISAIVMLYDKNSAYYLFGANHPDYRFYNAGTFLIIESMKLAHGMGLKKFDFVGVNSPLRGDFKLSFGGELMPYYIAKLNC
ncbi:MAG: GNAT family N-acetyltransferase [Acidaminococcales bacterium]|jgi:hypothetical protein|nr:GNAT family N-acetyltransferase [Acidaminococcales bacterium]